MYVDKLADIVSKYNNTYHSTIKMKNANVNSNISIDINEEDDKKDSKFELCDHVRISKYKNIFEKCYTLNWSEEFF